MKRKSISLRFIANLPKQIILLLIKVYQLILSPVLGNHCRYTPSCSYYTSVAVNRFGIIVGFYLGFKRIIRCHPWKPGGHDPVPSKFSYKG